MVEAYVSNWILKIISPIYFHTTNQGGALNPLGFPKVSWHHFESDLAFKRWESLRWSDQPFTNLRSAEETSTQTTPTKQHHLSVVQYDKTARLRMLTLACSSANAAFNRSTSSTTCHINEGPMLIGLPQEENSPEWHHTQHEVDYNLNLPIQIDIQSGNLINLLFPVFVYNDFESKNDHLLENHQHPNAKCCQDSLAASG